MSNPIYNKEAKLSTSQYHWTPYSNFLDIPEQLFAQQLTKMDCVSLFFHWAKKGNVKLQLLGSFQELFKRVIPHQCLGAVWSRRRDKNCRDKDAGTVVATVDQVWPDSLSIKRINQNWIQLFQPFSSMPFLTESFLQSSEVFRWMRNPLHEQK